MVIAERLPLAICLSRGAVVDRLGMRALIRNPSSSQQKTMRSRVHPPLFLPDVILVISGYSLAKLSTRCASPQQSFALRVCAPLSFSHSRFRTCFPHCSHASLPCRPCTVFFTHLFPSLLRALLPPDHCAALTHLAPLTLSSRIHAPLSSLQHAPLSDTLRSIWRPAAVTSPTPLPMPPAFNATLFSLQRAPCF